MAYTWLTPKIDWNEDDTLEAEAMNRIKNNINYLVQELASMGYIVTVTSFADVTRDTKATDALLNTLEGDINAINDAWLVSLGYVELLEDWGTTGISYTDAIAWENNLLLIKTKIEAKATAWKLCGHPLIRCSSKSSIF